MAYFLSYCSSIFSSLGCSFSYILHVWTHFHSHTLSYTFTLLLVVCNFFVWAHLGRIVPWFVKADLQRIFTFWLFWTFRGSRLLSILINSYLGIPYDISSIYSHPTNWREYRFLFFIEDMFFSIESPWKMIQVSPYHVRKISRILT